MPVITDVYQPIVYYDTATLRLRLWDGTVSIGYQTADTAAVTSVNDTNVSTTLLAANTGRLGGSIVNDSTAILYVRYGSGSASSTAYTVAIYPNGFHPILENYCGAIQGIWASDPDTGAARITELTT